MLFSRMKEYEQFYKSSFTVNELDILSDQNWNIEIASRIDFKRDMFPNYKIVCIKNSPEIPYISSEIEFSINAVKNGDLIHVSFPIIPKLMFHIVDSKLFAYRYSQGKNLEHSDNEMVKIINKAIFATAGNLNVDSVFFKSKKRFEKFNPPQSKKIISDHHRTSHI